MNWVIKYFYEYKLVIRKILFLLLYTLIYKNIIYKNIIYY